MQVRQLVISLYGNSNKKNIIIFISNHKYDDNNNRIRAVISTYEALLVVDPKRK
jgi:hypothetical protein